METRGWAEASARLFDILLHEDDIGAILDSLARIAGETLGVDRSLIFDVSFVHDHADGLTEWLAPGVAATRAQYPLAMFRNTTKLVYESRVPIVSHRDEPHPNLVADGSAAMVHDAMQVQTLLGYPFAFRDDGFYLLAFHHVRRKHVWAPDELEFMRSLTRHVSMALLKIDLLRKRREAEVALFQAQKLESLGVLAGGVAHDFNNLMVGVISNAELLARRLPPDSSLAPLVAAIQTAGQRAATLAGQLLAYSGKGSVGMSKVKMDDVVSTTIELVRAAVSDVPIQLTVETEAGAIDCNVAQFEQVVMNLVVNAAEAARPRSGSVRARVARQVLDGRAAAAFEIPGMPEPGAYVMLEVTDTGVGMEPETLKRIFDPFFTTKRTGRGLGLSAVLGIVKHHGGAIAVTSVPGIGSAFQVVWPAADGEVDLPAARSVPPVRRGAGQLVLCIDDDEVVTSAVQSVLRETGYACTTALGGAEGLARFDRLGREVACVVLDLTMPPPTGREVLVALRAARPALPVVLVSGYTDTAIESLLDATTRFVCKPFTTDELLAAIAGVMRS